LLELCEVGMTKAQPDERINTRHFVFLAMGFGLGNQEWRKRSANKGGRPTWDEMAKKKARDEAINRKIERWAEAKADWFLAGLFRIKRGRCPFCDKTS
jgi:hypothetical protein